MPLSLAALGSKVSQLSILIGGHTHTNFFKLCNLQFEIEAVLHAAIGMLCGTNEEKNTRMYDCF